MQFLIANLLFRPALASVGSREDKAVAAHGKAALGRQEKNVEQNPAPALAYLLRAVTRYAYAVAGFRLGIFGIYGCRSILQDEEKRNREAQSRDTRDQKFVKVFF